MLNSPYLYSEFSFGVLLILALALFLLTVACTRRGLQNGILLGLIVGMSGIEIRLFQRMGFLPFITLDRVIWPVVWTIFFLWRRQGKTARLPLDGVEYSMLAFATVSLISLMRFGNYATAEGEWDLARVVSGYVVPFSTYFMARRGIRTDQQLHTFFVGLGFMALYVACNGLAEILHINGLVFPQFILNPAVGVERHFEEGRIRGIFLTAGPHGLAIAMALPILIWLYFTDRVPRRWLWPLVAVLALAPLAGTLSRAGWLSAVTALGVTAMAWPRRRVVFTAIAVYIAAAGLFFASESILERLEGRLKTTSTLESRFTRIETAWEIFQEHPVFGAGLNRFGIEADQHGRSFTHAHNTWVTLLAELGLVGLFSYLAIFGCAFFKSAEFYVRYPQYRVILGILIGVTLAYLIMSTSMEIRGRLYHNTLLFALWGMILEAVNRSSALDRLSRKSMATSRISIPRATAKP
jgi:O-antigen ligase